MEFLILYFFVMVEKFGALLYLGWGAFWGGVVLIGLTAIISGMNAADYSYRVKVSFSDNFESKWALAARKVGKWFAIVGLLFGCMSYLVPSQKDLAIIIGGGLTYQAVTSDAGKRIGGKAISLLEQKIDSVLADKTDAPSKPEGKAL